MRNLMLVFFLLFGLTFSSNISAQTATNNTDDDWIVSYQGADTQVPANMTVTFTIGSNANAGRGVMLAASPNFCNNKFQATGTWFSFCAPNTNNVQYFAPTFADPLPSFVFNP